MQELDAVSGSVHPPPWGVEGKRSRPCEECADVEHGTLKSPRTHLKAELKRRWFFETCCVLTSHEKEGDCEMCCFSIFIGIRLLKVSNVSTFK